MEWLLLPVLGLLGQLGAAAIWWKTAGLILQIVTLVGVFSVILGVLWSLVRSSVPTLIFLGLLMVLLIYVDLRHPTLVPKSESPPKGEWEVSARWRPAGSIGRYWVDRKIPKEWKPYEALIRIRIGKEDLFIVMKEGRVYVLGINLQVKTVEPLTGR